MAHLPVSGGWSPPCRSNRFSDDSRRPNSPLAVHNVMSLRHQLARRPVSIICPGRDLTVSSGSERVPGKSPPPNFKMTQRGRPESRTWPRLYPPLSLGVSLETEETRPRPRDTPTLSRFPSLSSFPYASFSFLGGPRLSREGTRGHAYSNELFEPWLSLSPLPPPRPTR